MCNNVTGMLLDPAISTTSIGWMVSIVLFFFNFKNLISWIFYCDFSARRSIKIQMTLKVRLTKQAANNGNSVRIDRTPHRKSSVKLGNGSPTEMCCLRMLNMLAIDEGSNRKKTSTNLVSTGAEPWNNRSVIRSEADDDLRQDLKGWRRRGVCPCRCSEKWI